MRGISKTKFCKGTNIPKRSGNFSAFSVMRMHFKTRTIHIVMRDGQFIVGNHTPLSALVPVQVEWLMINDPNFDRYRQVGTHTYRGKQYEVTRSIYKSPVANIWDEGDIWRMEETINTEGDFDYNFPEY